MKDFIEWNNEATDPAPGSDRFCQMLVEIECTQSIQRIPSGMLALGGRSWVEGGRHWRLVYRERRGY